MNPGLVPVDGESGLITMWADGGHPSFVVDPTALFKGGGHTIGKLGRRGVVEISFPGGRVDECSISRGVGDLRIGLGEHR